MFSLDWLADQRLQAQGSRMVQRQRGGGQPGHRHRGLAGAGAAGGQGGLGALLEHRHRGRAQLCHQPGMALKRKKKKKKKKKNLVSSSRAWPEQVLLGDKEGWVHSFATNQARP